MIEVVKMSNTLFMSNDARKVQKFLDSKFNNREVTLEEIVATEQAILRYFPNPIINIVGDMLKRAKPEKLGNYINFSYHLPAMRRITSKRSEDSVDLIKWSGFYTTLSLFQTLLVVDYNHDTLLCLIDIAQRYDNGNWSYNNMSKAITLAIASGVRSPQYVMAILQKEYATKQATLCRANDIVNTAQSPVVKKGDSISFVEQMSVMATWDERKANNDIEKKLEELYRK